jgi:hypothetical protein
MTGGRRRVQYCRTEQVIFVSFAASPGPAQPIRNGQRPPSSAEDARPRDSAGNNAVSTTRADLASWLLAQELGAEADAAGLLAGGSRVCQKISARLARRVSADGAQAILSRALHLARTTNPILEGLRVAQAPDTGLEGLNTHPGDPHDLDASEVRAGLLAVVSMLLDLLVRFIGEELAWRMMREVWPDLPSLEPTRPARSDGPEASS